MEDHLNQGEQVVLTSPVDLKNHTGTLYLTSERLQWIETNGDNKETIYFSDIRSTLVSNATSKRVCLKLVTKQDALGSVFYFTSSNARVELDNFKDTLLRLSKDKTNKHEHNTAPAPAPPSPSLPLPVPNSDNKEAVIKPISSEDTSSYSTYNSNNNANTNNNNNNNNNNRYIQQGYQQSSPQYPLYSVQTSTPPKSTPPNSTPPQLKIPFDEHEDYMGSDIPNKSTNNINNYNNSSQHEFSTTPPNHGNQQSAPSNRVRVVKEGGDDEDFFSIKGEDFNIKASGWPPESDNSSNNNKFDISVRDPQQEVGSGSKTYVSYEVVWSRNGQPQQKMRRRYKDFEWLYQHIVGNYQHRTTIPPFPSKSIMTSIGSSIPYLAASDGGAEFTQKRCQALDKFMKAFVRSPILQSSKSLAVFLSPAPIEHDNTGGVAGFLGKVESHLSGTSGRHLDDIDVADQNLSDVEQDYKYIRKMMMQWELTPKKLPFEKFLVVVLGTTSAGKSAFVNHLYGLQVKRSAVGQMDTHFTLVETLPKEKFAEYSEKAGLPKPNFSDADLAKKITGDVYADPRYGHVFYYLDTFKTLSRYEAQFTNYAHYISNYGLVRSIVINEEYLRGSPEKIQLARRTILLDSPGFDYTKENEHAMEKFLGNLKILQLFYSMSDLSLFMTPATHINMVSNQIATLELSVLYSLHGPEYVDKLLTEILSAPSTGSGAPTHLIPSIVDIKNYVVQKFLANTTSSDSKKAEYKGTVVWDKIRFVLTKIDEVFVNQPVGNLHEQYFELGRLLGKHLTYLEAPTFSQCMAIALPEHAHVQRGERGEREERERTGDLQALLDLIRSLNSESSYMGRLEASVQMMCLELQSAIKASWTTWISPKQWVSSDTNQLHDIYRRSCLRLKKMSMNGGANIGHQNLETR